MLYIGISSSVVLLLSRTQTVAPSLYTVHPTMTCPPLMIQVPSDQRCMPSGWTSAGVRNALDVSTTVCYINGRFTYLLTSACLCISYADHHMSMYHVQSDCKIPVLYVLKIVHRVFVLAVEACVRR